MDYRGTIYPDGSIVLHGFVALKWRLLGVNASLIAWHSPGGCWWDNGGKHYGPATVEVHELEDLRRGNAPGTWEFKCKRVGLGLSFHPTPKTAVQEAIQNLERWGDGFVKRLAEKGAA